jgi:hypothetical protein
MVINVRVESFYSPVKLKLMVIFALFHGENAEFLKFFKNESGFD